MCLMDSSKRVEFTLNKDFDFIKVEYGIQAYSRINKVLVR